MRPLPRLHAITDAAVLAREDFPVRAAAIAAAGSGVALHARDHAASGRQLLAVTRRLLALAGPPEAAVFVNGRPDLAIALGAQGIQLAAGDLSPDVVRQRLAGEWTGWIGVSVHSAVEAQQARDRGADFLLLGSVFETPTHPGVAPTGLALVTEIARAGTPVVAIGGITPARSAMVRDAGGYGVAAISALWSAEDPAAAALALLSPWMEEG
jgi:thiamine-phosphate diphosphorylase